MTRLGLRLALGLVLVAGVAAATEEGLFAGPSVRVDDATVRRIHDPQNHVYCYVVTGDFISTYGLHGRNVAVACMPAVTP